MAEYIPSPADWVREPLRGQRRHGGIHPARNRAARRHRNEPGEPDGGNTQDAAHAGEGRGYVLVGSKGGAPQNPVWVYNLRANGDVEIRDKTELYKMRVREVEDEEERARLWELAVAAYPPYEEYQERTPRRIPVFVAEPA